ncbi:MAG: transketolase [Gemmatimonadetes bacterium]|nr:transketolase [Gemmatimonadota bacterium]
MPEQSEKTPGIVQTTIDTIRTLSMDAVQAANSGHPGAPMALAPVMYTIWQDFLRYDPEDPLWPNRDRFVLSNGHASMLLYSMLFLAGVRAVREPGGKERRAVTLEEIRRFRQLGSATPGHPEHHLTSGVETTTGPLGQGVATSVGLAAAAKWLGATYNRPGFPLFDYDVYVLCGDGDLMEGVCGEAASLAGHLRLSNLCWLYDNNHITIEGPTSLAFTDDTARRFEGYGWRVLHVADANDLTALRGALAAFRETTDRPTLIIVDSHIGYGSPKRQDTREAHGEPLGEDQVRAAKEAYGWDPDAHFLVPDGVREHVAGVSGRRGRELREAWTALFERYAAEHPEQAEQLRLMWRRELPAGWDAALPTFPADAKGLATRDASGKVLNAIAQKVPWVVGGAADLWPSTKTLLTFEGAGDFEADHYVGRNFHFGVREHAMAAAVNGLGLSALRAYSGTFLVFADYAKPAIRLSALMELPVVHVFTHDSIGLGEDGPTHQPIEQLAMLRAIPGLAVVRPADANEVVEAWKAILRLEHEPAALVLTRQAVPTLDRSRYASAAGLARGAYILEDAPGGEPEVILIGTGSEVALCAAAHERLLAEGVRSRLVSMPCWQFFERQDEAYRESVLPRAVRARVAVEAASTFGWERWVGPDGAVIGMTTFGTSAPAAAVQRAFGFTPERVVETAKKVIEGVRRR